MLGWTVYGRQLLSECGPEKQFLMKTGQEEFEKLCSLDVLGLADKEARGESKLHEDFIQQLNKTPAGYYETKLPWKEDHVPLPANKNLSAARLVSTTRKLEKTGRLEEYHQIMQEQVAKGITRTSAQPSNRGGCTLYPSPGRYPGKCSHYQNVNCLRLFSESQQPKPFSQRLPGDRTTTTAFAVRHPSSKSDAKILYYRRYPKSLSSSSSARTRQRRTAGPVV